MIIFNDPALQEQHVAFENYRTAKARVDQEPTFENARAAARAWKAFLLVFDESCKRTDKVVKFSRRGADDLGGAP